MYSFLSSGVLMSMGERKTEDGFEMHMGINYLGHYLFAHLLVPMLKNTAETGGKGDVRIVMTASFAHNYSQGPIRLQDLNFTKMPVMTSTAYAQSKVLKNTFERRQ
jgi:NAD(P)-dependent dehydrogenase (short-subunit alcohol dehydrogenase family)